jgi:hypothetical protein
MPQLPGESSPRGSGIRYSTVVHGLLSAERMLPKCITHSNYGVYIDRLVNVLRYLIIEW